MLDKLFDTYNLYKNIHIIIYCYIYSMLASIELTCHQTQVILYLEGALHILLLGIVNCDNITLNNFLLVKKSFLFLLSTNCYEQSRIDYIYRSYIIHNHKGFTFSSICIVYIKIYTYRNFIYLMYNLNKYICI